MLHQRTGQSHHCTKASLPATKSAWGLARQHVWYVLPHSSQRRAVGSRPCSGGAAASPHAWHL